MPVVDDFMLIVTHEGDRWLGTFPAAPGLLSVFADTPYVLRSNADAALDAWLKAGNESNSALQEEQYARGESAINNGHEVWWITPSSDPL